MYNQLKSSKTERNAQDQLKYYKVFQQIVNLT